MSENRVLKDRLKNARLEVSELESKVKRLEYIYNSIPSTVAIIQNGKIININETVKEMLGYTPEELVGKRFLDIIYPDSRAMVREIHAGRLAGKVVPEQYEVDLKPHTGNPLPCEARVGNTLIKGKRAFVVSLMPMDNRLEREESRLQAKKMEALLTMASALAGRFEKTCSSIQNRVDRLKSAEGASGKHLSQELQALGSVVEDAIRTTAQLRVITRSENEFPSGAAFDFGAVVNGAVTDGSSAQGVSEGEELRVRVKTYLRSGSLIQGSPEELRAVISNLIRNAIESMPNGGDLYVTSEENQGYAHLYIMDNGTGVSEQVRDRIFDPYFTTRGGEAEGLGLSVAYAVIRRHGGSIKVTSEKSQGTEIHIQLPVAGQNGDLNPKQEKITPRPSRVLVIVKNRVLENLLARVLSSRGWDVVSVDNTGEGLNKLQRETFGLTLLESSPWGNRQRAWLCKKIKELGNGLPIALITEDGWDDGNEFSSGFDLILKKPLQMDALNETLTGLLLKRDTSQELSGEIPT